MKQFLLLIAMVALSLGRAYPYVDPTRAAAIEIASSSAKKAEQAYTEVQLLNATGHIWYEAEVSATTDFQREFNDYLDKFHGLLAMTAEVYGLYYEVNRTIESMNNLSSLVSQHPTNTLAVAFSARRNDIYSDVIETGIDVIMDIRELFFNNAKMTAHQRIETLSKIRPKLHVLNKQLRTLYRMIKYTTFLDVWREITDRDEGYQPKKKREIAAMCIRSWKANIGMR